MAKSDMSQSRKTVQPELRAQLFLRQEGAICEGMFRTTRYSFPGRTLFTCVTRWHGIGPNQQGSSV